MLFHLCIDVRGVLRRTDKELGQEWANAISVNGQPLTSGKDIRRAFLAELDEGHLRIPFGEPCEGFDYTTGCPGHIEKPEREGKGRANP
jgi:hypothetical protein